MSNLSIRRAIRLQLLLVVGAVLLVGLLSLRTIEALRINGTLYERIADSQRLIGDILPPSLLIIEPYLTTIRLNQANAWSRPDLRRKLGAQIADYRQAMSDWRGRPLPPELLRELERSEMPAEAFFLIVDKELLPALEAGRNDELASLLPRLDELFVQHRESIARLAEMAHRNAAAVEREANSRLVGEMVMFVALCGGLVAFAVLLGRRLARTVNRRVGEVVAAADAVARGDLRHAIDDGGAGDEIATILRALESMRVGLAGLLAERERQNAELASQAAAMAIAKARAEQVERLKSEFLATLSHELRTPLNGIQGMLAIVATAPLDDEYLDYVNYAERSAAALYKQIDDMLFYARLQADSAQPSDGEIELQGLLEALQHKYGQQAAGKGLAFEFAVRGSLPLLVRGDPAYLQRALEALLENAVKFTASGRVDFRVERQAADGADRLLFTVEDSGPGLPEEGIEQLFSPFVQHDGSQTRSHGGTGLGLALCQALVGALGGALRAANRPAGGACFVIELPLSDKSLLPAD